MASTTYAAWSTIAPITIANAPSVADYPVRVDLTYAAEMNADFSDIRFVDASDNALSYWIESYTASTSAVVWVKVASGAEAISVVYGNAAASSESDGADVFDAFDDFPGTSLDSSKWSTYSSGAGIAVSGGILTITGSTANQRGVQGKSGGGQNTAMMARVKIPNVEDCPLGYMNSNLSVFCLFGPLSQTGPSDGTQTYVSGYENKSCTIDNAAYHVYEIKRNGSSSVVFSIDGVAKTTHTVEIPNSSTTCLPTLYAYQKDTTILADWFAVRKCQATEPVCTVGTARDNTMPARETFFQWPYAIEYTIANPPAVDGYQVPLTVAWKPGMRLDFRDLRFRDENLTPCRFRLESYTAGSSATFLIGIWPHQTRLSVLYGNGAAASASDP